MIFAPLIALYDGIYRGSGKTEFVSKITLIAGILSLIPVIFLVKTYLLWGALMSQNLYLGVLLLILALNYRSFDVKIDTEVVREIVRYSLIIGGISTAYTLFAKVDTLILGHYGYVTEIGYFELANKVIFLLLLPAAIFSQVESPTIAALSKESGSRSLIIKKLNVYTLIFVIMGILLAISTYLIALPILEHYFTKYYIPQVVTILSIYLLTYVFHSVADAIGNTFIVSTGHARLNLINVFVFGLISTTLAVIFIAKYGYIGLVYSKLLTVPLSSIVLLTWYNIAIRRS
jgi:O-antigen/teichoic acid export membrane protein